MMPRSSTTFTSATAGDAVRKSWANTPDRTARTAPGRAAAMRSHADRLRLERERFVEYVEREAAGKNYVPTHPIAGWREAHLRWINEQLETLPDDLRERALAALAKLDGGG